MPDTSRTERETARRLRSLMDGHPEAAPIEPSDAFKSLLASLEIFIPELLAVAYPPEWERESLDAFRLPIARKTAEGEAELLGLCLLISDQTWTPFYCRIRCRQDGTAIERVSCKIGICDATNGKLVRIPYGRPGTNRDAQANALLTRVTTSPDSIDWTYCVERTAPLG